jgi:hypothetical protein
MSSVSAFTIGCGFQDESYDPPVHFEVNLVGHKQHFYFLQKSRIEKKVLE